MSNLFLYVNKLQSDKILSDKLFHKDTPLYLIHLGANDVLPTGTCNKFACLVSYL